MLQSCGQGRVQHKNPSHLPIWPWTSEILHIKRDRRYGGLNIKVIFLLLKIKEMRSEVRFGENKKPECLVFTSYFLGFYNSSLIY